MSGVTLLAIFLLALSCEAIPEPFYRISQSQAIFSKPFLVPHFLVIGQQKSGTTTLFKYLTKNPNVRTPRLKELLYWCDNGTRERCDRSIPGYLRLFDRVMVNSSSVVGEFSATYLACQCCPDVIKALNPKTKIIVVLREPVTRALSRYLEQRDFQGPFHQQVLRFGNFSAYAKDDIRRIKDCIQEVKARLPGNLEVQERTIQYCYAHSTVVGLSAYSLFLKNWLKYFPSNQILLTYTTNLSESPADVLKTVEDFIGVPNFSYPPELLGKKFNGAGCYGWHTTCNQTQDDGTQQNKDVVDEQLRNINDIVNFLQPSMAEFKAMVQTMQGTPPKNFWRFYPSLAT